MKTYRNDQLGFEIDIPKEWSVLSKDTIKTPFGESVLFGCGQGENFNIEIGWSLPKPIEQIQLEFTQYAKKMRYTELKFGKLDISDVDHVWARYCMDDPQDWAKKYLIYFGETEYAITGNCIYRQGFLEREKVWDRTVQTFRLITPVESNETTNKLDRMNQAAEIFREGYSHFRLGRYLQALYQFEKGKMVTHEFPWNFFGTSMTLMQMIETHSVPEDQISMALKQAEKNLQVCILINPTRQDYLDAMKVIQEYKKKHRS